MYVDAVIPGRSGFSVRRYDGYAVVRLPAEIDSFAAPAIAGELSAVLDSGARGLIVDMSGTGCCDAACLGALVRAARRARGWGAWVRLVVPDPHVRMVVELVSLDGLMPVYGSVSEAAAAGAGRVRRTHREYQAPAG